MKRIGGALAVVGALAFAPSALAFGTMGGGSVNGSGTFGSPSNSFSISASQTTVGQPYSANGTLSFSGTDTNGTHSFGGIVTCLDVGTNDAGLLATVTNPVGQPSNLYGVLVHVTAGDSTGGTAPAIDVTRLNHNQYTRQYAAGCAAAFGKAPVTGAITVSQGGVLAL